MPSSRRLMRYCERVRPKIHSLGALRIADQRETISCSGQRSMLRSSRALCALRRCAKLASSASCLAQEMNALGAMERCSRSMLGTSRRSYQRYIDLQPTVQVAGRLLARGSHYDPPPILHDREYQRYVIMLTQRPNPKQKRGASSRRKYIVCVSKLIPAPGVSMHGYAAESQDSS